MIQFACVDGTDVWVNPAHVACVHNEDVKMIKDGIYRRTCEISFGPVGGYSGPDVYGRPSMFGVKVFGSSAQVSEAFVDEFMADPHDAGWFDAEGNGIDAPKA